MSSICKKKEKKKGMKGRKRGCDQRTKIRCIYRHGSRPRGPNTMWRVSRKTNSASQRTAVSSSCERWNLPSKRSSESCLSISPFAPDGPVPLISEEVLNRNLSSAPWLRALRFSPAATCSRVGGHSTVFVFFTLPRFEALLASD